MFQKNTRTLLRYTGAVLLFVLFANLVTTFGIGATVLAATIPQNNRFVLQPSTTTLASSANPAFFGQTITLTATVTGSGGIPSGTVTFRDGVTTLGTVTLNAAGVATFSTSGLSLGVHSLTALYNGSIDYTASTSNTVVELVIDNILTQTLTNLTSSSNPATFGESLTFTATVISLGTGVVTPTGTVTFTDGTTILATRPLASDSVATYTISSLAIGTHPITAQYGGDSTYAASTSTTLNQQITAPLTQTTTTLASNPNPSFLGQTVVFSASITINGSGAPATAATGSVTFKEGALTLGSGSVINGAASFSTSSLGLGVHSIIAIYSGDSQFANSTSTAVNQLVINIASGTTTNLTSSLNPSQLGQTVTFNAVVSSQSGTPTGLVTFLDNNVVVGTGSLNANGLATFSTSALAIGTHPITARYEGNTNYASSTSAVLNQQINSLNLEPTNIVLNSSPNPANQAQLVVLTATVTAQNSAIITVPSGLVVFKDGATVLASSTLDASGVATYTTTGLAVGTHPLTAVYNGDTIFAGSVSAVVTQVLTSGNTGSAQVAVSLSSNPNPSAFGQTITFSATVTPLLAGTTPTGTVTFKDGSTVLGTASLDASGVAVFTNNTLTGGTHSIVAIYSGNATYAPKTSDPLTQVVIAPAQTTTSLTSSANPGAVGQAVTFSASVAISGSTGTTPSGTVTFKDGSTALGTASLNASGVATFTTSGLALGTHSISAQYNGDSLYSGSVSEPISQVIKTAAECLLVTSGMDGTGCGTLRGAIELANSLVVSQDVTITVATSVVTLTSSLPIVGSANGSGGHKLNLLADCTVDDVTGRGIPGTQLLRPADAGFSGSGLTLANNVTVRGFSLTSFAEWGIDINGNNNQVKCNWIGTANGTTATGNASGGIRIRGSNNLLGASDNIPAGANLVSGNGGYGILVESGTQNYSLGIWVGLAKNGTTSLKNATGVLRVAGGMKLYFGPGNRLRAW